MAEARQTYTATIEGVGITIDWVTYADKTVEAILPNGERYRLPPDAMQTLERLCLASAEAVPEAPGVWRHKANFLLLLTREAMTPDEINQADQDALWRGPAGYYCRSHEVRPEQPAYWVSRAVQEALSLTPEEREERRRQEQQEIDQAAVSGLLEGVNEE